MKMLTAGLAAIAVLGAAATFGKEYDVAFFARSPEYAAFETLSSEAGAPGTPFSSRAVRELLMTCGGVQQGLLYAFQPSEIQDQVDANCTRTAEAVLMRNPTNAAAHTIIMYSSREPEVIAQSMIRSQATAPREAWHAKLRLQKSLSYYGTGNAAADSASEADITFLVQSSGGRTWLARLYQDQPEQRPVITQVVGQRSNEEKQRFIWEVRKLGQN